MEFFNNHLKLFGSALLLFIGLTLIVAILPALKNQKNNAVLPNAVSLSEDVMAGKRLYISNGCVACHTQQVRNIDMDKIWGDRAGIAADYAGITRTDFWRNTATLMGTERTGPDLSNVGKRQGSQAWNLLHLFQPRSVVEKSIMPAYPWLFEVKDSLTDGDIEVMVPEKYRMGLHGKIVARKEALQLVAYLQSLIQTKLPDGISAPPILYQKNKSQKPQGQKDSLPDGQILYATNCQSCHQANGEGLLGAFPPLKGSAVVSSDDIETYVTIIMRGYDARAEFGVMPAVGTNNNLSSEEITAIINHERSSWGNNAEKVSVEDVKKIIEFLKLTAEK